jgi:hypothetical protein
MEYSLVCYHDMKILTIRCFWPPDNCMPPSPHSVLYACGNALMKSCALACLHAAIISSSVASGLPLAILLRIVPLNSTGS